MDKIAAAALEASMRPTLIGIATRAGIILAMVACAALATRRSQAHEIYTPLHSKSGFPCCGGSDCSATIYRERGDQFEFLSREGHWIRIPGDRIIWMHIPGDPPSTDANHGHMCYRQAYPSDADEDKARGEGQEIRMYCIFGEPGAI